MKISVEKNDKFNISVQDFDCGYMLEQPGLTSTHNLCFGSKSRKIGYLCKPQFYYVNVGYKGIIFQGHVILTSSALFTHFLMERSSRKVIRLVKMLECIFLVWCLFKTCFSILLVLVNVSC